MISVSQAGLGDVGAKSFISRFSIQQADRVGSQRTAVDKSIRFIVPQTTGEMLTCCTDADCAALPKNCCPHYGPGPSPGEGLQRINLGMFHAKDTGHGRPF